MLIKIVAELILAIVLVPNFSPHLLLFFSTLLMIYFIIMSRDRILGRNWDQSLKSFLPAIHSHLYGFYSPPPPPPSKSGLKLVRNVNIVNGNLKSEHSQVYAQKP